MKAKQLEEEKLIRDANKANAANKVLNNCTANIDKNILNLINDPEEITLRTLFDESTIKYQLTDHPKIENSITWTLKRTEVVNNACVASYNESKWLMIVMSGEEYLKALAAYKTKPNDAQSIKSFVKAAKQRTQCDIILMVYDLVNCLKNARAKEAKNHRKNFKNRFESSNKAGCNSSTAIDHVDKQPDQSDPLAMEILSPSELQDLRLLLEMEAKRELKTLKLHIDFSEKTEDIIQMIAKYTVSVAKHQLKQKFKTSTGLDWAINMDKERATDPTKSKEDLTKLWMTQLQQFSQITLPIAKAIVAEYPSPSALMDQYKNLTTSEGENLLAELYSQRYSRRQIGPHISKKIHCFMTCKDPNFHIGYS